MRIELTDELERASHAGLVVTEIDHALGAPEQVGRDGHIAELGEPIGDAARVFGNTERFVQQNNARTVLAVLQREVGVDRAVERREADRLRARSC